MRIVCTITDASIGIAPEDIAYFLKDSQYLCFIDNRLVPDKYSSFSYIAWEPSFVLKSSGIKNEFINIARKINNFSYRDPLGFFKEHVSDLVTYDKEGKKKNIRILISEGGDMREVDISRKYDDESMPDFIGGFLGYFSYDLKDYLGRLSHTIENDQGLPLFYYGFYSRLLAYEHNRDKWYFIKDYIIDDDSERLSEIIEAGDLIPNGTSDAEVIRKSSLELEEIKRILGDAGGNIKKEIIKKYLKNPIPDVRLRSNLKKEEYLEAVKKIKDYIYDGDTYQVNFSHRFQAELPLDSMDLYYILRIKNVAPFSVYLKFPEFSIGSSSPERFLYLKDDTIETRPIKGTRSRGKDGKEDLENARELKESKKDRAELNMIVDLERNDLGKFCYYGTIKVADHAVIEKYARVFHSVSTVTGEVKKGTDTADIIKATFPGGSITGAPKIRSMEIIDELETVSRGVYSGSIGYISIDNTMDLNIAIRTFIIKDSCFYYNVGGGIVADSQPEMEYLETLDKGKVLEDTLNFFKKENLAEIFRDER